MTGIVGTMTVATRIATAAAGPGNGPGAKIFELRNLPQDCGALLFQTGKGLGHDHLHNRAYQIRSVIRVKKTTP
jgi:hypothetical protein